MSVSLLYAMHIIRVLQISVKLTKPQALVQGSLLSPKIEFFIKGDMTGLSFFSGGHL